MPGRKRAASEASGSGPPLKKQQGLTIKTVQRWMSKNDKALSTTAWMTFDNLDREYATALKCSVCIHFNEQLRGTRRKVGL